MSKIHGDSPGLCFVQTLVCDGHYLLQNVSDFLLSGLLRVPFGGLGAGVRGRSREAYGGLQARLVQQGALAMGQHMGRRYGMHSVHKSRM